jgi:hypothetical protein
MKNKLILGGIVGLVLLGIVVFSAIKSSQEQKLVQIEIEKQEKCTKDGREFDKIFIERKSKNAIQNEVITEDGRFIIDGWGRCVYQNNWVELFTSQNTITALVHHRIINVNTQEELAGVDWSRKFINNNWEDNLTEKDIENIAKFIRFEKTVFENSIIFSDIEEYENKYLEDN